MQPLASGNPYVGPRSIQADEPFYGRDRDIRSITSLLIAERIVLLHAPSGAGKSSLIQAGLTSRLSDRFHILPIIRVNQEPDDAIQLPDINRYLLSTLISLEEAFEPDQRIPGARLATLSLDSYLRERAVADSPKHILLLFDQFEEILTTSSTDQTAKLAFFEQIGDVLQNPARWALFSIREDYIGGLAPFVRTISNRLGVRYRLDLLSPNAAMQAIQQPAKKFGGEFTDSAARALIADLRKIKVQQPDGTFKTEEGPSIEPVQLQVTCFNVWDAKKGDSKLIVDSDLRDMGNVDQALASYYSDSIRKVCKDVETTKKTNLRLDKQKVRDNTRKEGEQNTRNDSSKTSDTSTLDEYKVDERIIRKWVDEYLITPEGVRGQVLLGLNKTKGIDNSILKILVDCHLIRSETRGGKTWYELSHDRLVEPIVQDNAAWYQRNLSLLQRQASIWDKEEQAESLLLREKELSAANKEAKTTDLTQVERRFLDACNDLRKRKRTEQFFNLTLIILTVSVVIMFIIAGIFGVSAQMSANGAEDFARKNELAARANQTQAEVNASSATKSALDAIAASTSEALARINENDAQEKEQESIEFSKVGAKARADQLAAYALNENNTDYPLKLLLGLESYRISENFNLLAAQPATILAELAKIKVPPVLYRFGAKGDAQILQNADVTSVVLAGESGIKLWDLSDPTNPKAVKTFFTDAVHMIAISPDHKIMAINPVDQTTGTENPRVVLWDIQSNEQLLEIPATAGHVSGMAFGPDGTVLAVAKGSRLELWAINPGQKTATPAAKHPGEVHKGKEITALAYRPVPNGGTSALITFGKDSQLRIWNADQPMEPREVYYVGGYTTTSAALAFSEDGGNLAVGLGDGSILYYNFFDPKSPEKKYSPPPLSVGITGVAINQNKTTLAIGDEAGRITLWNIQKPLKLEEIHEPLAAMVGKISSLMFSANDTFLIFNGSDTGGMLWDMSGINRYSQLPADQWPAKICQIAGRNLSLAEWKRYFPGEIYRATCPQWPIDTEQMETPVP